MVLYIRRQFIEGAATKDLNTGALINLITETRTVRRQKR
jgi:hypothetical protein